MNILITICARGGSKGIPGKNIKPIGDKPLIAYTIEHAKRFSAQNNGAVVLSTDSDEIKTVAKQFGLETDYTRPSEYANDTAGKVETIAHLLLYEEQKAHSKFEFILDLDVSSPMRTTEDLSAAFNIIKSDENALNLFSVNPANRNPYFNMVEKGEYGYCKLAKILNSSVLSRQAAPLVYDLNASFYFYRREFFAHNYQTVFTEKSLFYEMPHICFDLDELLDFEFLNFLIENNKLGFEI